MLPRVHLRRIVRPIFVSAALLASGCGGGAASAPEATTPRGESRPGPVAALDLASVAAPLVDLLAPTSAEVLVRGALVKSDEPPTDAWDQAATVFARSYCIGVNCFRLVDLGNRSVPSTPLTGIGDGGSCEVEVARARAVRAHLDPIDGRPAVDQAFVLLEFAPCPSDAGARLEAVFGSQPVRVLSLRDAAWHPATRDVAASLESFEERARALFPGSERVPVVATDVLACGVTIAAGLSVYWLHDGQVHQPFDAARFVRAGESLYAFSYVEGLDPMIERLDRVTCGPE